MLLLLPKCGNGYGRRIGCSNAVNGLIPTHYSGCAEANPDAGAEKILSFKIRAGHRRRRWGLAGVRKNAEIWLLRLAELGGQRAPSGRVGRRKVWRTGDRENIKRMDYSVMVFAGNYPNSTAISVLNGFGIIKVLWKNEL